jgi:hypothetical protein
MKDRDNRGHMTPCLNFLRVLERKSGVGNREELKELTSAESAELTSAESAAEAKTFSTGPAFLG